MDSVTKEFIKYYSLYLEGVGLEDIEEEAGNWACKYCENQAHVNQVLNEIDKELKL